MGYVPRAQDRLRLAIRAMVSPSTIDRVYRGDSKTRVLTLRAVVQAAQELGLPAPPEAAQKSVGAR